jgi:hypothetical protein
MAINACWPRDVASNSGSQTVKRFNRTAQAFRPGKAASKCALKGRPTGTGENEYLAIHVERPSHSDALVRQSFWNALFELHPRSGLEMLSGRIPCGKNPGLEGLGYGL